MPSFKFPALLVSKRNIFNTLITTFLLTMDVWGFKLCDDSDVPTNGIVTKSPWFRKCNWECKPGYAKVRTGCCLDNKPPNSTWTANCKYMCNDGFELRHVQCCKLPPGAKWSNVKSSCSWQCRRGKRYDAKKMECVDATVQEKSHIYERKQREKDANSVIDQILEREIKCEVLPKGAKRINRKSCAWKCSVGSIYDGANGCVEQSVREISLDYEMKIRRQETDNIIDLLLEEELSFFEDFLNNLLDADISREKSNAFVDNLIDRLLGYENDDSRNVEMALDEEVQKRSLQDAGSIADTTEENIDNLDAYLRNSKVDESAFDTFDAAELEAHAEQQVDSLISEVEFLKATIRFQNERLKRRKSTNPDETKQLREALDNARDRTEHLKRRSEEAQRKLTKAQQELAQRGNRVLLVYSEKIELLHVHTRKWVRIRNALLDTGNSNVCTISEQTAKALGLWSAVGSRSIQILGVLPGKVERWPLVDISLRIKERVFNVTAAVGGSTPILVSHTDVIAPLMKRDGYVIAG